MHSESTSHIEAGLRDISKASGDAWIKFNYFLLAAAAAAIAFAVEATSSAEASWTQIPLGVAVLCWAASFYSGCLSIRYSNSQTDMNARALSDVYTGSMTDGRSADYMESIVGFTRKSAKYMDWQLTLVYIGAIAFLVWHMFEMLLRTAAAH